MNARRQIIAALSEDSLGGIATLQDVDRAEQLVDAHRAEVLAEVTDPAHASTPYAIRTCICDDTPHPTWCPASIPTDERITEIRNGVGEPITQRELFWLKGAAARHELHVIGARGGHWPLTDDLSGALLLVSQYLAAAVAVVEGAGLTEEKASAAPYREVWDASLPPGGLVCNICGQPVESEPCPDHAPKFFQPGHTYAHGVWSFYCGTVTAHPETGEESALGWLRISDGSWTTYAYSAAEWGDTWTDVTEGATK